MSFSNLFNGARASRTTVLIAVIFCLFYAGYFAYLEEKESEADVRHAKLQASNVAAYLDSVGETKGFDAYFAEFSKVHDYATPQENVPPFLLGRWATSETPKQVRENYVPETCHEGVMIEDGRIKVFGEHPAQYDVTYRIDGDDVLAGTVTGSKVVITPVAYTRHIHHLLVALPGLDSPLYAYLCK